MADDLGDSHCKSLGQGGRIPDNSTNERVVGRIFAAAQKTISIKVKPEVEARDLTVSVYDKTGAVVATASGVTGFASPLQLTHVPAADGWYNIKVRNTVNNSVGQRVWVNVNYTAPVNVNTRAVENQVPDDISIWTGNKGTSDVADCGNWESGLVPSSRSTIYVYGHSRPFPVLNFDLTVKRVNLMPGAVFTVDPNVKLTVLNP
jgi:hypothetical protein